MAVAARRAGHRLPKLDLRIHHVRPEARFDRFKARAVFGRQSRCTGEGVRRNGERDEGGELQRQSLSWIISKSAGRQIWVSAPVLLSACNHSR